MTMMMNECPLSWREVLRLQVHVTLYWYKVMSVQCNVMLM